MAPIIVTIRGHSFSEDGSTGSSRKLNLNQFSVAPPKIAPRVRAIIGEVIRVDESFTYWKGRQLDEFHTTVIIKRIEYLAVIAVAKINKIITIILVGLNKAISIIRSLE